MTDALAEVWRQIIIGDHKSWVLFANGTCVILMEPADDLASQATAILRVRPRPRRVAGWRLFNDHARCSVGMGGDGPSPRCADVRISGRGHRTRRPDRRAVRAV